MFYCAPIFLMHLSPIQVIVTHNNYFFVKMTHNEPILKTHVIL